MVKCNSGINPKGKIIPFLMDCKCKVSLFTASNSLLHILLVYILSLSVWNSTFAQTTTTLQSIADTEIYSIDNNKNYGGCNLSWIGPDSRKLLKFNLSSIPANATILSATLTATKIVSNSTTELIEARMITSDWTEGTGDCAGTDSHSTWINRTNNTVWNSAGGDFNSTIYASTVISPNIQNYSWDIKNMVQGWINGSYPNFGLMLKKANEGNITVHEFATKEASNSAHRPTLKVTYLTNSWRGPIIHTIDQKIASGTGTTATIEKPSNTSIGDLILLVFSHQRSPAASGSSFTTPSGFTLIRSEHDASSNNRTEVVAFYKIAGSSEPANYTSTVTTYTNTPNWKAYAIRITNVNFENPIGQIQGVNSGSSAVTSLSIPSGIASVQNSLLVNAFTVRASTSNTSVPNQISYISYQNGTGADGSSDNPSLSIYSRHLTTNLDPGTHNYGWTGAGRSSGLSFYVNPSSTTDCGGEANVILNPEFDSGATSWDFYVMNGTAATLTQDNTSQLSGINSARVNITTAFGTDWHIQLLQANKQLIAGKTYRLKFMARASANRTIVSSVDLGADPWTNYFSQTVNLTTAPQSFEFTYTQSATTNIGRVVFNLAQSTGTVWIDNVEFYEVCGSPGGVPGVAIWFKANAGVTSGSTFTWADQSGFNRNGVQSTSANQPTFTSVSTNFNPAVTFDGTDDKLIVQNLEGLPIGASMVQEFAVGAQIGSTTNTGRFFSYGWENLTRTFFLGKQGNTNHAMATVFGTDAISTLAEFNTETPVLAEGRYNGTQIIVSSFGVQRAAVTATSDRTATNGLIGAGLYDFWKGPISEIILYPTNLDATEERKVNSYLAIKYGITLDQATAQNYLNSAGTVIWNGTTNSGYKNHIAGIARDDASALNQKQSKSQNTGFQPVISLGVLATNNQSNSSIFAADKSALVWGSNTGTEVFDVTINYLELNRRMSRIWKVQETGTVGTVKVYIRASEILPSDITTTSLLVSNTGTFDASSTKYSMSLVSLNSVQYYTADVDFNNGQFFTFGGVVSSANWLTGSVLWLKADAGVTTGSTFTWEDLSGTGWNVTQSTADNQPTLSANSANFNPAVVFDGNNDFLSRTGITYNTSSEEFFAVVRPNTASGDKNIIGLGSSSSSSNVTEFRFSNNMLQFGSGQTWASITAGASTNELWNLANVNRTNTSNGTFLRNYGTQVATGTITPAPTHSQINIGARRHNGANNQFLSGQIAEVIIFPSQLTAVNRRMVESYLALKYGITLNQSTLQNYIASDASTIFWNATTNTGYNNNIAGIVRDINSGLNQKQSKSVNAGLQVVIGNGNTIAETNALNSQILSVDKSALVWGDNGASVASWTSSGAPAGYTIISRSWKVQETGTVGSVKISVPSSGANGLPASSAVTLLLDADGNFTSGSSGFPMTLNNGNWEVNVDLTNGQFFTFANCAAVTTPVFALGGASSRCQGAGTVTYTATSNNSTGMTYQLDGASLAAGNTINSATGAVSYVAGWTGTSTITATATGCGGPLSSNHVVTINPNVGTPSFSLGSTSTRCQGAGTVTYTASANNNTGLTYSLDAASLSAGNTINTSTGAVTYNAGWSGTSIITVSAAGCAGPVTAMHTVTITPSVGTPVFALGSTSSRCQEQTTVIYTATATNNTGISYSLDAISLAAGNSINATTGAVNYTADWNGTTIITVTALGCNGPKSANHTVTTNPSVQVPIFTNGTFLQKCQNGESITFTATAQNNTGLSYSLDASSLAGGNTINSTTGQVIWNSAWIGISQVTATATGCNGPVSSSFTIDTKKIFANDDFAVGLQGRPLIINLSDNDLCNVNPNSIVIINPPQNGNVQMGTGGDVTYLPAGNFSGNDQFIYQICSTIDPGQCEQAAVYITINETFLDPCAEATRNKIYYLPFEENSTLRNALLSAGTVNLHTNIVRSVISIKIPYPGIKITYDHWEDGYESNILSPVQSTTQIWGDGNLSNGVAPGYPDDILPPGAYIVLDNQFQYNPRVSSTIAYDGRDKIFTTGDVAISKVTGDAGFGGGSVIFDVQNLKTNVYDITRYGEYFVIPFGEDISLGGTVAFRYTGASIKAAENGTIINLDYNGDGVIDQTQTLNEGEFWYYSGTASVPGVYPANVNTANDIKAGAVITANKPVGVDMVFGDGFNFGTRNLALLPSAFNASVYYTPVYTTTPTNANIQLNAPVYVFFTNVLETPITIQWTSKTASGTITVPASSTNYFEIPYTAASTGYRFESVSGQPFSAVAVIDADADGSRYDWTFNLIPEERLTSFTSIAWAPGSRDGSGNYNPIWITPTDNTTIYVKFDGNLTGTSSTLSPCGIPYDIAIPVQYLDSYRLYDMNDNDQTGTAIYTCDGVRFTAVWGQDSHANGVASPPGSPSQDVGYVLEPKCLDALIFANDDSRFTEPNTPVTIQVSENDFAFLCNLNIFSVSLAGLRQPMNGTTFLNGDGTVTYLPNPGFEGVDFFEYSICSIEYPDLCDIALVTIRITDCPATEANNTIIGTVFVEQLPDNGIFDGENGIGGIKVDLYLDVNCNGVLDSGEGLIQSTISGPDGAYAFNVLNGFNAYDNFEPTPSFSNNSGGVNWSTSWIEQNDDLNLSNGYVRIIQDNSVGGLGNAIRLSGNASATLRGISRSLTFNNATAATLRFKIRREGLNNQGEELQVMINGTQVLAFDDGDFVGTDLNYIQVNYNLASFNANGSNVVLFRVNSAVNADDYYWIDDVELVYFRHPACFITKIDPAYSNGSFTASALSQQTSSFSGLNTCVKNMNLGVLALLVATDDVAYTAIDFPVTIPVLQNDVIGRPNINTLSTSGLANQPENGTIFINPDGTITYTPYPGFSGVDDFEYRICSIDDPNVCDIALVTVSVFCVNIPNKNSVTGKVFFDNNLNSAFNSGESGIPNITVELYRDYNGNGVIDPEDILVDTKISSDNGDYQFIINPPTTNHTYRDNFNTNGSANGSDGTSTWTSAPWLEVNESNGFGSANVWITNNQLRLQGENTFYLDQFNANTTANQSHGTVSWAGQSWVEIGESNGFATNQISITSANALRISGSAGTTVLGARRMVPLSTAGAASLSFTARSVGLDDQFDFVDVQVASSDAGPWTTLTKIIGPAADVTNNYNLTIPVDLLTSTTTIRFVSSGFSAMATNDIVYIDNVRVTYVPISMFKGAARTANIINALSAQLSLDFEESGLDLDINDYVDLQISVTPAGPWTLLRRFTGADGNQSGNYSVDISNFIASGTTIRFVTSPSTNFTSANVVNFDNIQISYQLPAAANYIVKLNNVPESASLLSPPPPGTYQVSFIGAGEGVCNRSFAYGRADLSVIKSASADTVNTGGLLNYTISVTNNGPTGATNVLVNDVLPEGYTFSSASPSAGSWTTPNWNIGTLSVGQTVTLQIYGSVNINRCESFTNNAIVTSNMPDPNIVNNSSSVEVTVIDNVPPTIEECAKTRVINGCSANTIDQPDYSEVLNETNFSIFSFSVNDGSVSDNCGLSKIEYIDSISGSCPITVTRMWIVTDKTGNSSTCTQTIIVQDTIAPMLNYMADHIYIDGCGTDDIPLPATTNEMLEQAGIEVEDNCTTANAFAISSNDQVSGQCPIIVTRTYTIKDLCNNSLELTQYIYIQDTLPPLLEVPDTIINLGCNPTLPTAADVENLISVSDNCAVNLVNITARDITGDCDKEQTFLITVTDNCGNESQDSVIFKWKFDTIPPDLTVPVTGLFLGTNPAIIPSKDSVLTLSYATDFCGLLSLEVIEGIVSGTCEKTKTYDVIAIDSCGNTTVKEVIYSWIDSLQIPVVSNDTVICYNDNLQLVSAEAGSWVSSDVQIATINALNEIQTVNPGQVLFTFTRDSDGCSAQTIVTIKGRPLPASIDSVIQPDCYTPFGTAFLSSLPDGDWTLIVLPDSIIIDSAGNTFILDNLSPDQSYRLVVSNENQCYSDTSEYFSINPMPLNPNAYGDTVICPGTQTNVFPDIDGIWISSDTTVARVNNSGLVTGMDGGIAVMTYTRIADGCQDTVLIEVLPMPLTPVITVLQEPTCYVQFGTILITNLPESNWELTRLPDNVKYSGSGASFTLDSLPMNSSHTFVVVNENGCQSQISSEVDIIGEPAAPEIGGDVFACFGLTAKVTPTKSGVWISSDTLIATVNDGGLVTGISPGHVVLTYIRAIDGCSNSIDFYVKPEPEAPYVIDIMQPTCLEPTGSATLNGLPSIGNWFVKVTPGEMIYQGTGEIFTISGLPMHETYYFNFEDDDGCISETSAPVQIGGLPENPVLTGDEIVCIGDSIKLMPDTAGLWVSDNNLIITVNNQGWVTGINDGIDTVRYIRISDGCIGAKAITVLPLPLTLEIDTLEAPGCAYPYGKVILKNLPVGEWEVMQQPGGIVFSGDTNNLVISDLQPSEKYYYTVMDSNQCKSALPLEVDVPGIPENPTISGVTEACLGTVTQIFPSAGGQWESSDTLIAKISNTGWIESFTTGQITFRFTRDIDGCISEQIFTIRPNPVAEISGPDEICFGSFTTLTASGGSSYLWNTGSTSGSIQVNATGNYKVTVTNSFGCQDSVAHSLKVNPLLTAEIDFNGSVCYEDGKIISAAVQGGSGVYSYNWSGPGGFTADTDSIVINSNGNYYLTVTDNIACTATTTAFVYEYYNPFVSSLQTTICEGDSIQLSVNSATAVSYLWSTNAGGSTDASVIVYPEVPFSVYSVTVTNDLGCTATPELRIDVNPRPEIYVNGIDSLCTGDTTLLYPSSGGTWSSLNPLVAIVSSTGVVTAINGGNASFIFTEASTGCSSLSGAEVKVFERSNTIYTGPTTICEGTISAITPSTGGTWTSNNPDVATIDNDGIITGITAGTARFTFVSDTTGCASNLSAQLTVVNKVGVNISGPSEVCEGLNIELSPSHFGGTWQSSDTTIAIVNNSGIVTARKQGSVAITYQYQAGPCIESDTKVIMVHPVIQVSIDGPEELCPDEQTILLPSTGGIWTSTDTIVATVTNQGIVTAHNAGFAQFIFTSDAGCQSEPTSSITVKSRPGIALQGPDSICINSFTAFLPATGGTWVAHNPQIATITNSGIVFSAAAGTARFSFISNDNSCISDTSVIITVTERPVLNIDYHGSVCLTDTSRLSVIATGGIPGYQYAWTGPSGFNASTASINVSLNGNYYVTVTDNMGCTANVSGFVYQRFESTVINFNNTVCEGINVNLSVNSPGAVSYLWSENANSATTPSVTVTPQVPSSTYFISVTNNLGCVAVANASINVLPKPAISLNGPGNICVGQTTQLLPSSGGIWSSLNPGIAIINNSGFITGVNPGIARFINISNTTGCSSDTSVAIVVQSTLTLGYNGPSAICIGAHTQLTPIGGGIWSSNNPSVATITSDGYVTGLSTGTASFTFTSAANCVNNGPIQVIVNPPPSIVLNGSSSVCIGATTQFLPSSGGTWQSVNPSVASITNSGVVTGLSTGTARFIFTSSSTGCKSDTSSAITILPRPTINVSGNTTICVGATTTLSPTSGGTWTSNNPSIASVTNTGIVTGLSPGTATFTFTDNLTSCSSIATAQITFNPRPAVNFTGPTSVCIGETSQMTPTSGGVWTSSNPAVATISNSGLITSIAPGVATFTFTSAATGCTSNPSGVFTVNGKPIVDVTGGSQICIGSTTTLFPSLGGSWISSNPQVATVSNIGIVTGVSVGTATFTFQLSSTGCMSDPTSAINVFDKPTVSLSGPNAICIGEITTLSPSSGGSWNALNPSVASVSTNGIVTGVNNGIARFTFTNSIGCTSDPTNWITVNGKPNVILLTSEVCTGNTAQALPSINGVWTSTDPGIATITNTGLITGLSAGNARFIYQDTITGCVSDTSGALIINPLPQVSVSGPASICVGVNGQLTPTTGGTWTSLSPSIASVSNNGLVTGLQGGKANFRFIHNSTGCATELFNAITIIDPPTIALIGDNNLCIGEQTNIFPNSGGTWQSLNPQVATVSQSGVITANAAGSANFRFTSAATGCSTSANSQLVVNPKPTISISGGNDICIGGSTILTPGSGGSWLSSDPLIASVNNSGVVTGVSPGIAKFVFLDSLSGCQSDSSLNVTVNNPISLSISGPQTICVGYNTELSAISQGVWFSTDPRIATITTQGKVTGIAPGKVSFYFVESSTGCISYLPGDAIFVINCVDPDFNVTFINRLVSGNVSTNDDIPGVATYGTPILVSKPASGAHTITMNPNGTYSFSANYPGKYVFNVPVCIAPAATGCPARSLEINVVAMNNNNTLVSNPEMITVYENGHPGSLDHFAFNTMANDACISRTSCSVSGVEASIMYPGIKGSLINQSNILSYWPNQTMIGRDTIKYYLNTPPDNDHDTRKTSLFITINAMNALNSTVASDDFYAASIGQTISGNVLLNDSDPEGDQMFVTPQGTALQPVQIASGSYYIDAMGNFVFTPAVGFNGPTEFTYQVCDNNPDPFCTKATVHILIAEELRLSIRAYLEGSLMNNSNQIASDGRPLMRDNLRNNPNTGQRYIPSVSPYTHAMQYIDIRSRYSSRKTAGYEKFDTIHSPNTVFSVTGSNAIVDWVFVELRNKNNENQILGSRSALIQRDGDIVDTDGINPIAFPGLDADSVYIVVRHRNHLAVMSQKVSVNVLTDFTKASTPVYNFGLNNEQAINYTGLSQNSNVKLGYRCLWAGDFDADGKIKFVNPNDDQNILFFEVLIHPDNVLTASNFNFAYGYYQGDFNMDGKAKYDNPDDDKNLLFSQILLYPLNTSFLSNFNFFIEQLPEGTIVK